MDASRPLPDAISEIALGTAGLRGWKITTPVCRALVSEQGAQLLEFQALGRKPLLWLSPRAHFQPGKAIRGGIPLCFPWFGPHPGDSSKPAHGFARTRNWSLLQATVTGDLLQLEFRLQADAGTRALWPHDFVATLVMTLGRTASLQLHVENAGTDDFRFGFAMHSYFPVADIRRARLDGLEGIEYIDQLHPTRGRFRQDGPLRFTGETDRIYLHTPGECCLADEAGGQAIRICSPDCRSIVAWNPWQEKTARLADMAPEAWQGMVCVESGNVEDDQVTLPAGASKVFSLLLESEA
jgi:glucose-6-phosphate 1-epimerase